jgi:selenocysteine lyase/cysteine desulfurase
MIYLNPAGLSPFRDEVQQAITRTLQTFRGLLFSESGIQHYRETLRQCRRTIADWLEASDDQCLAFMPNTTTACSLTLSRIPWQAGDRVVTTIHENSTILQEINELKSRGVEILSVNPETPTNLLPELEQIIQHQPIRAIVISHVSHLDGRIFPIELIQDLAQSHHILLIVDGAQAVGQIPVSFSHLRPDAYFFPGHKWCEGPMGTGVLITGKKDEHRGGPQRITENSPVYDQPDWTNMELGTHNIGLIAGLAKACDLKRQEGLKEPQLNAVRTQWKDRLRNLPGIRILEWDGPHAPGILSFICLNHPTEQRMNAIASDHDLSWKTFTHPSFPNHLAIRISWSTVTLTSELHAALSFLKQS